jgi:hypothetical protein
MIWPDLPSPAEAGFAKAGNRFRLVGIMLVKRSGSILVALKLFIQG